MLWLSIAIQSKIKLGMLEKLRGIFLTVYFLGLVDFAPNRRFIQRYAFSVIDTITDVVLLLSFLKD